MPEKLDPAMRRNMGNDREQRGIGGLRGARFGHFRNYAKLSYWDTCLFASPLNCRRSRESTDDMAGAEFQHRSVEKYSRTGGHRLSWVRRGGAA